MRRIAVSGHRGLPGETARLVAEAVGAALRGRGGSVTGLSCLADGADQIFARAVLDSGGQVEAVIPAREYRAGLPPSALAEYDALLAKAMAVHELPYTASTSESHMAASEFMIGHTDELWAVWDGQPTRGYGGTADVITYARSKGVPVQVIWPEGARRDLPRPSGPAPGWASARYGKRWGIIRYPLVRIPLAQRETAQQWGAWLNRRMRSLISR